jgi:hypothetical protein
MKSALKVLTAVAVLAAGGIALAGDCCGGGAKCCGDGFSCQNMCPLAKTANTHRSFGTEGSMARQTALAAQVQKSLARV